MAISTAVIRVQLDTKEVQKGIKNISNMFSRIQKNSAQRLARAVANIASISAFKRLTSEAKEFERTMSLISGRLGMTTDHIANMQMAFNRFNKSGAGVQRLLGTIAHGVSAVKFGDGKFVSKLAAMGIRYRTATGGTKSNEQIMYDIADWTKAQLARGRSEQDLRYLLQTSFGIDDATFESLRGGSAVMRKIQADYQKATGGIKTKNIHNMRVALDKLSSTFDTLGKKIEERIAPAIEWVAKKLDKLGQYFSKNDEIAAIIAGIIALLSALTTLKWVLGIGQLIGGPFKLLGFAIKPVIWGLGKVALLFTSLSTILGGLALAIGGIIGYFAGSWLGDKIGDWLSKTFGSGDRTTEEFWDKAAKEGKITREAAQLGKEHFVVGYINKNKTKKTEEPFLVEKGNSKQIEFIEPDSLPDLEDYLANANLEQAIEEGSVIFTNDIDVDVQVDKNGGVQTSIEANGQTNNGQTNHVSYTGKAA